MSLTGGLGWVEPAPVILDGQANKLSFQCKRYLHAAGLAMFTRIRQRFLQDAQYLHLIIRRERLVPQVLVHVEQSLDGIVMRESLQVMAQGGEEGLSGGRARRSS